METVSSETVYVGVRHGGFLQKQSTTEGFCPSETVYDEGQQRHCSVLGAETVVDRNRRRLLLEQSSDAAVLAFCLCSWDSASRGCDGDILIGKAHTESHTKKTRFDILQIAVDIFTTSTVLLGRLSSVAANMF